MAKLKKVNISQIEETFKNIENENISSLGLSLIKELRFMGVTLNKLKKEIRERGVITMMDQGKYTIERSNPAITSYNTMVKNYNSTIKQISDLLQFANTDLPDNFEDDDLM